MTEALLLSVVPKHGFATCQTGLGTRNIGKSDQVSLVIIDIDDMPVPDLFETCVIHRLKKHGVVALSEIILGRIAFNWKSPKNIHAFFRHPASSKHRKNQFIPCSFTIKNTFEQTKRWSSLADIDIKVNDKTVHKDGMKVFLIPSGNTPPFVNHSVLLKTDKKNLELKRKLATDFARQNLNNELQGALFYIDKDVDLPHVYCTAYDDFILENWTKYTNNR